MDAHDSADEFYFALVAFLLQAKQQIITVSSEYGLTSVQALTLLMLDTIESPSMTSFCKLYDCDASNITGIIDGLEDKKLVSRQPHPGDRRKKIIRLEPAGTNLRAKIIQRLATTSDHLFTNLGAQERQQFESLIKKLASSKT